MININLLDNLINLYLNTKKKFRHIYQKSNFYDKKISKIDNKNENYFSLISLTRHNHCSHYQGCSRCIRTKWSKLQERCPNC